MNQSEQNQFLKSVVEKNGHWQQIEMLQEEMGEVLQAINKLKRTKLCSDKIVHPSDQSISSLDSQRSQDYCIKYFELCSEFADLRIMLNQMSLIFDAESISLSEQRKIERLSERMKK